MRKLLVSLGLPALCIAVASLVQDAVATAWPGIRMFHSAVVSVDSYVAVLLTLGLCFCAGRWVQQNVPAIAVAACALIVPLTWLVFVVRSTMVGVGPIAWLRPLTLFTLLAALAPLLGVSLGWVLSTAERRRMLHAV